MLCVSAGLCGLSGCSNDPEPRPLGADQFYRPTDQSGALPPGPRPTPVQPTPPSAIDTQKAAEAFRTVAGEVKPATSQPTTVPTTVPTGAKTPSFAEGQFINLGGVIAEVNGNPVYADDVLREVAPALAARAKDLELEKFKAAAAQEISRQVDDMIRAEVEFAAADRNTARDDKELAERLTEQWRSETITANKGSIEATRAAFREQGMSLEDATKERYRINLVRVYYTKKLFPRVQVTAAGMRSYYEANKETKFTVHDNATFRLIKASSKDFGSEAAAKLKIDDLHARAVKGEDFEELAKFNQDPMLLKSKGMMGPIDRGAYVLEDVEKAIWATDVGQITPVVKVGGDYYFAKVLEKKLGRVMAFSEEAVQKQISDAVRAEQFGKMRKDMDQQLRKDSVVTKNPQMYENALQMAVQSYPQWRNR